MTTGKRTLLEALRQEMEVGLHGGIYHHTQVSLTYNSNHIEGSRLTEEQTRLIFETKTIGVGEGGVRVDDIVEAMNHFRCIDLVIKHATESPTERLLKQLHATLKQGTTQSDCDWFAVGDYKRLPNEVGGQATCPPADVAEAIKQLLEAYNSKQEAGLDDLLDLHVGFERIHPFQDGNGRVGRLLLFKECLRWGLVPCLITDELKGFYYRGLREWPEVRGYLRDTCLTAQDIYAAVLRRFGISTE